jgi:hypothetical protein
MTCRRSQVYLLLGCWLTCAWPVRAQTPAASHAAAPSAAGPSPARAPSGVGTEITPLSESLTGQAKADYDAGRLLFGDDDFAGSLVKFQRAFDHVHDVRLLWNMAVCEKNLRHYARVLRLLERYQREGDQVMSPAHRAEVAEVLATVRSLVSTVHINVQPDEAELLVDEVPAGTTPLREPLWVDLGERRIRIRKLGFKDQVIAQDFAGASELTFDVTLQPEAHEGQLAISAASGDSISVDGKVMGQGQWQGTLSSGQHSVRISAPGKRAYVQELLVEDDKKRSLYITLEPEKSAGLWPLFWVGAGVVAAAGLATGGYFLLRSSPPAQTKVGTWDPGTVTIE